METTFVFMLLPGKTGPGEEKYCRLKTRKVSLATPRAKSYFQALPNKCSNFQADMAIQKEANSALNSQKADRTIDIFVDG